MKHGMRLQDRPLPIAILANGSRKLSKIRRFRGILDEFTTASPSARTRLQQAMRDAILRYLTPVLTESKAGRVVTSGTR
jgi:hypothetical protein